MTAQELQGKAQELNDRLIDVMIAFGEENPEIPAQVLMAGLGQLLVHFSLSQTGEAHTLRLIDELRTAAIKFSGSIAPQH
jgi:hypothetical protein